MVGGGGGRLVLAPASAPSLIPCLWCACCVTTCAACCVHCLPCPALPCPVLQTNFDARDYTGETIPPLTGKTREEVKTTLKSERIKQVRWVVGVLGGLCWRLRGLCAARC